MKKFYLIPLVFIVITLSACTPSENSKKIDHAASSAQTNIDTAIKTACSGVSDNSVRDIHNTVKAFGALGRIAPQYQPMAITAVELEQALRDRAANAGKDEYFRGVMSKKVAILAAFCSGLN